MNQKEILTAPKVSESILYGVGCKPLTRGAYIFDMGTKVDLTGQRFSRLIVIREARKRDKIKSLLWVCRCDCGSYTIASSPCLKKGDTKSCGCLARELIIQRNISNATHGHTKNRKISHEYYVWAGIKNRCNNPNHTYYKYYGGRGITICSAWGNSFENFLSCVGSAPSAKHTIDRIDNNGNYEMGNVRWATKKQQANNRVNTMMFNYNGQMKSISELAELANIKYSAMKYRLKNGWDVEQAITRAVRVFKNTKAHRDNLIKKG